MNRVYSNKTHGFTLVELLVVMLVLVALSSITLDFTKDFAFQGRYEVTKDRYDKIKRAIIGRPDVLINGQPDISGFVADMGRLPRNIQELLVQNYCSDDYRVSDNTPDNTGLAGTTSTDTPEDWCTSETATPGGTWVAQGSNWKGPYLTLQKSDYEPNAFSDGWGNEAIVLTDHNYGWAFCLGNSPDNTTASTCYIPGNTGVGENQLAFQSKGKNGSISSTDTNYDEDYPDNQILFNLDSWTVSIPTITVNLQSPSQNEFNCSTNGVAENACKNTANWKWFGKPECRDASNVLTSDVTPATCTSPKTWYWFTGWPAGTQFCVGGTSTGLETTLSACTAVSGNWIKTGLCSSTSSTENTLTECLNSSGTWRQGWCVGGSSTGNEVDSATCVAVTPTAGTWHAEAEWPLKNSRCSNRFFTTQLSCESAGHRWIEPFCTNLGDTKAECIATNESWVIPFCSVSVSPLTNDASYTESTCSTAGGVWGGCLGTTNSKNFCDANAGIWLASAQEVDLRLTYSNGSTDLSSTPSLVEENGLNQNIVFDMSLTNVHQGIAALEVFKTGTSDIYPPSCSGLSSAQCVAADGAATDAVLLNNNLCDNVTAQECTDAGGQLLRSAVGISILPYTNNININW